MIALVKGVKRAEPTDEKATTAIAPLDAVSETQRSKAVLVPLHVKLMCCTERTACTDQPQTGKRVAVKRGLRPSGG